jgi:transposase
MEKPRVTGEEQEWMQEMHRAGMSVAEIAETMGRSRATVSRMLRDAGANTARRGPWDLLTPFQQEQVRADYRRGYSLLYLKRLYGVDSTRLLKEMERAGIEPPSKHVTGIERLLDLEQEVLKDYLEGAVGAREVARRFGVHEGTMTVFLQQRGVLKTRGAQAGAENAASKARQVGAKDRDSGKYWARRTVELALGRPLPEGWVVHHMNENPRDQRQSNLWLFHTTGAHSTYHRRQSELMAAGGLVPASQTASESGGLWLPELIALLPSQPETVEQLLSRMPE